MAQSRPSIVIVGGGIGGLFAANALIAQGLKVSVYEQAPTLSEVGAGVYITPNCVRQLQRVGVGPAVERWGARVGNKSQYFHHDGTVIAGVQVTDTSGWNATYGMHRADLVGMLVKSLSQDVVHTGRRCTGYERHGQIARVTFDNGEVAEGDVVVGADGIHSVLRQYVHPEFAPSLLGNCYLPWRCSLGAGARMAGRELADVARQGQTLPCLSAARRKAVQLCRVRAGQPGTEGIVVGGR